MCVSQNILKNARSRGRFLVENRSRSAKSVCLRSSCRRFMSGRRLGTRCIVCVSLGRYCNLLRLRNYFNNVAFRRRKVYGIYSASSLKSTLNARICRTNTSEFFWWVSSVINLITSHENVWRAVRVAYQELPPTTPFEDSDRLYFLDTASQGMGKFAL